MKFLSTRRDALRVLTATIAAPAIGRAAAQADKPLKLIVITPPGAIVDASSRTLAEGLRARLNRPVLVENKTGAGGNLATDFVAKAEPDGNTLLVTSNNHTTNPYLYKLPYDAEKDLVPVAHTVDFALVIAAHPSLQASTVAELVALAKAKPNSLSFASGGNGSPGHLAVELLMRQAGIRMEHIPYKGASPAMTDAVAGQVQLAGGSLSSALPFLKTGQLKGIGVSGRRRAAAAPQVPTLIESGLKDYDYTGWIGVMAPKGVPLEVRQALNAHINAVVGSKEFRASVDSQGGEVAPKSVAAFAEMLKADFERNRQLIRSANITL